MLRRPADARFAPGAHVFPGGALDPSDHDERIAAVAPGFDPDTAGRLLRVDAPVGPPALAYFVAACREVLEEVGLLIGAVDGRPVASTDTEAQRRVVEARRLLLGGAPVADALAAVGVTIAPQSLTYAGRFITPEGMPRRFDTRFFAARVPDGQSPDFAASAEAQDGGWFTPEDIARLEFPAVMPPTRIMCTELSRHASVGDALAALGAAPLEGITMIAPGPAQPA